MIDVASNIRSFPSRMIRRAYYCGNWCASVLSFILVTMGFSLQNDAIFVRAWMAMALTLLPNLCLIANWYVFGARHCFLGDLLRTPIPTTMKQAPFLRCCVSFGLPVGGLSLWLTRFAADANGIALAIPCIGKLYIRTDQITSIVYRKSWDWVTIYHSSEEAKSPLSIVVWTNGGSELLGRALVHVPDNKWVMTK